MTTRSYRSTAFFKKVVHPDASEQFCRAISGVFSASEKIEIWNAWTQQLRFPIFPSH
jgi:hypothetical protein